jgi:predicted RNase H-like HicB family nuclease
MLRRRIKLRRRDLPKARLGSYSETEDRMEAVRVIYHHEADGWWAGSPDVDGWSAAGDTYAEVVKLAEEGVPFALDHVVSLEHYVPAGEHVAA